MNTNNQSLGIHPNSRHLLKITTTQGIMNGKDLCSSAENIPLGLDDLIGRKDDSVHVFCIETIKLLKSIEGVGKSSGSDFIYTTWKVYSGGNVSLLHSINQNSSGTLFILEYRAL